MGKDTKHTCYQTTNLWIFVDVIGENTDNRNGFQMNHDKLYELSFRIRNRFIGNQIKWYDPLIWIDKYHLHHRGLDISMET